MWQFISGKETFSISKVQFFFSANHTIAGWATKHAYALISMWSLPDLDLLKESSQALYVCSYLGQETLKVIEAKTITSVVAMVPMTPRQGNRSPLFFLLKQPGLDTIGLGDVDTQSHESE